MENEIREFSGMYIKKLFKDINTTVLRRFNSDFKHEKGGSQRNWVALEEGQIKDLWQKCKAEIEPIFQSFKYIEIPTELSNKVIASEEADAPTPMGLDP